MSKEYRVIEILNKNELLINYGSNQGASVGRKVTITIKGEEITDPETTEIPGTLDIIKGNLEIYTVYPNFSICRDLTYEDRDIIKPFGMRTKTIVRTNPLNISEDDISGRWPKTIPPIKVGDIVSIQ